MSMIYYAGKAVQFMIAPVHITLILLVVAAWWRRRRPKTSRWLALGAVVLIYAASLRPLALTLCAGLESQHEMVPAEAVESADAIVLLGGTVYPVVPGRPEAEELAGARVLRAARLFHAGKAPFIICAGGVPYQSVDDEWRNEAKDMRDVLLAMRVPSSAILLEERSRNTNENARFSAELLRDRGDSSILLVTSSLHMPRAKALFEREGCVVIPAPSGPWSPGTRWRWTDLLPTPEALHLSTLAINEYVGYHGYQLLGLMKPTEEQPAPASAP